MANYKYRDGLGSVGAYQASTIPYLSSSINVAAAGTPVVEITFPNVTKFITVKNTNDPSGPNALLRVGFSENGINGIPNNNFFILENDESFSADWRITSVFLRIDGGVNDATVSVIAGATGIDSVQLLNNWSGSIGVG